MNCCNGRVGARLSELQDEQLRLAAAPTGVEIIKAQAEAGLLAAEAANCCNGRVGRSIDLARVVAQLTATEQDG